MNIAKVGIIKSGFYSRVNKTIHSSRNDITNGKDGRISSFGPRSAVVYRLAQITSRRDGTRCILVRTCITTLGLDIRNGQISINELLVILGQATKRKPIRMMINAKEKLTHHPRSR